jgi:hypothetical protein
MLLTHRAGTQWNYGQVETALCLWEAVVDMRTIGWTKQKAGEDPGDEYRALETYFDGHGSFSMRAIIASMVPECDRTWEAKKAIANSDDCEAFDFEFCPEFIVASLSNGLMEQAAEWQCTSDNKIADREWAFPLDGPRPPMTAAA